MSPRLRITGEPLPEPAIVDPGTAGETNPGGDELVRELPGGADATTGRRRYEVITGGWRFELTVEDDERARLRERASRAGAAAATAGPSLVRAQIPGRVARVFAAAGDAVEAGQRILSIEAMKMENEVRAKRAGTIARVLVAPGAKVELGDELAVIE